MSSTWERRSGIIAGRDLGGCYCDFLKVHLEEGE